MRPKYPDWLDCCRCLLLLVFMALSSQGTAQGESTLQSLLDDGKLTIKLWVEPARDIVATQQVTLYIEVATDSWFTAGTRIGRFELEDAIVLRRENFAVNSTRRVGSDTFTVQVWSLEIYPQRAGAYKIPPIPLTLSIASAGGTSVTGKVTTSPLEFSVGIPAGIAGEKRWVASNNFSVEENWNRKLEGLQPGDAIQRQITISAENVAAMMLPGFQAETQPGLASYQKPAQISDTSNRGSYRARRIESITYMIEQAGSYLLPAHTFYWWDLDAQRLQSVTLPERLVDASAAAPLEDTMPTEESVADAPAWLPRAGLLLGLATIAGATAFYLRRRKQESDGLSEAPQLSDRELQAQLDEALRQQDWPKLVQTLYQWLDHYGGDTFDGSIRQALRQLQQEQLQPKVDQLMQAAYYARQANAKDIEAFTRTLLDLTGQDKRRPWWQPQPISLTLN